MKISLIVLAVLLSLVSSAGVHELQLNVSTTTTGEAKVKASSNFCEVDGKIAYRKPSKMKIRAVVWGDACETTQGAIVWNETLKVQYAPDSEFAWEFLNRIGKEGKDAEGLCDCAESDRETVAHGTWTMKYNASASKKYDETGDIEKAYKFPKYVTP